MISWCLDTGMVPRELHQPEEHEDGHGGPETAAGHLCPHGLPGQVLREGLHHPQVRGQAGHVTASSNSSVLGLDKTHVGVMWNILSLHPKAHFHICTSCDYKHRSVQGL